MRISWPILLSLLPGLALASPDAAQDYGVTTTATGNPDPTATGSVVSVHPGDSAGSDLADTLAEVPGVHPRRTSYGQTSFATVRGGNARQVWVEWEGLKLAPPFGPGYDLSALSLLGVDDIVVWRGPAATFRGSGALTGALELRTRHRREPGWGARASLTMGAHRLRGGTLPDASELRAEGTLAQDDLAVRVGAAHRQADGDFPFVDEQGVEHRRLNNDHERVGLFASTEKRFGGAAIRATAAYDEGERGTPGQSEFQEQFRNARLEDRRVLGLVRIESKDLVEGLDVHAVTGHQIRQLEYRNPTPFLRGEPILQRDESATSEASSGLTFWGPAGTGRAEVDVRHEAWRGDVDVARSTVGVGASLERRLLDDHLGLWGAVRGETVGDVFAATPGFGVWWIPGEVLLLRLSGGRTFRAPDFDELYLDVEGVRGNPDLRPESAWSADLGMDVRLGDVVGSIVYFERFVEDEILFLPVTAYLVEAQNIDGTHARGLEAQITGDLRERVYSGVGIAWVDARFRETREPVPLQPAASGFGRLEIELGRKSGIPLLEQASKLRLVSEADVRSRIFLDSFGNKSEKARGLFDFGLVGGRETLGWSLFVRNAFDVRTAADALQQPQPGRSVWASIRVGAL